MWRDLRHRPQIQALKAEVDRTTGLLCFSSNWVNPVLWSHYGDRHRGVCLGFDLPRSLAQPVTYCAKRMAPTHPIPSRITKALEETLLFTKFDHWQYESEIRMPVPLGTTKRESSLHFLSFIPDLTLAEVILGEDCTLSLADVRQLVSSISPTAITFKARLAGKSYNVVPVRESVP